jgi:hypothetical protein
MDIVTQIMEINLEHEADEAVKVLEAYRDGRIQEIPRAEVGNIISLVRGCVKFKDALQMTVKDLGDALGNIGATGNDLTPDDDHGDGLYDSEGKLTQRGKGILSALKGEGGKK